MSFKNILGIAALAGALLFVTPAAPIAAAPKPGDVGASIDKAIAYLATKQNPDGSFAPKLGGPGVTALIAAGLIRNGRGDDPVVKKALAYLEKSVQDDGGIYNKALANYSTCVALIAFKEANTGGKYDKIIANATKFLKTLQNHDDKDDARFGGVGYDGKTRPDLSNSHFYVEALLAAGVPKDDPAIRDALIFLSRCQNLPSEFQTLEFAKKATDDDKGGLVYNPLLAPDKKDGKAKTDRKDERITPEGGLRSEGGMTYAGLKSFLYAGVGKDDARVKAAIGWIRKHYTLEKNPGMGEAGLFYYYHTFAKAMDALGDEMFEDADGKKHDWRQELFDALKKKQAEDGSWVNKNPGFGEGTPELATAFAVLSLSYAAKK
jgi:squalene-hopene/tetraprenyl-beta-curcumene cyclase